MLQVGAGKASDRLQRVPQGEYLQLDVAVVVAPQEVGALVAVDALEVGQDRAGEVLALGVGASAVAVAWKALTITASSVGGCDPACPGSAVQGKLRRPAPGPRSISQAGRVAWYAPAVAGQVVAGRTSRAWSTGGRGWWVLPEVQLECVDGFQAPLWWTDQGQPHGAAGLVESVQQAGVGGLGTGWSRRRARSRWGCRPGCGRPGGGPGAG